MIDRNVSMCHARFKVRLSRRNHSVIVLAKDRKEPEPTIRSTNNARDFQLPRLLLKLEVSKFMQHIPVDSTWKRIRRENLCYRRAIVGRA